MVLIFYIVAMVAAFTAGYASVRLGPFLTGLLISLAIAAVFAAALAGTP